MFDDLRNDNQALFEDGQPPKAPVTPAAKRPSAKKKSAKFLGMTAFQRFIIATLLFVMACVMGVAMLVLTGKVALF
jgi:hypothetical protein